MKNVELGQALFWGGRIQAQDCPQYILKGLRKLENKLLKFYPSEYNPFQNTGNVAGIKTSAFEAHSFDWSDSLQPFNFKYKNIEISWYKYLGRGMTISCPVTRAESSTMIKECLKSLDEFEAKIQQYAEEDKEDAKYRRRIIK